MTHPSKNKGNRFERWLVTVAKESQLSAERAYASDGQSLGEAATVDVRVEHVRIQAKSRKKIASYLQIPEGCDAVAMKQNFGEPLVLLRYVDFLDLLKKGKLNGVLTKGDDEA